MRWFRNAREEFSPRPTVHPGGYRAEILNKMISVDERVRQWTSNQSVTPESRDRLQKILSQVVGENRNGRVIVSFSHDEC